MVYDYDAIIIGAGIAGSSTAKALADKGWRTACLDRHTYPRHKVCGEFLSAEAKRTLVGLGLLETTEALQPRLIDRVRLSFGQGKLLHLPLTDPAFGISRYELDRALQDAAERAGASVMTGAMVTRVVRDGDGYAVEWRQGAKREVALAKTVIAAWGRQPERDMSLAATRRRGNVYIGLKSHYMNMDAVSDVELYVVAGGYIGIAPIADGRVNVAALLGGTSNLKQRTSVLERLADAAQSNRSLAQRLRGAVPVHATQCAVYPVELHRRPSFWDEYPRVGDAGLMIPPLCGDGMSIALYTSKLCADYMDRYLRDELSLHICRHEYVSAVHQAVNRPLRWGRLLQRLTENSHAMRGMQTISSIFPGIAALMVQATRLHI